MGKTEIRVEPAETFFKRGRRLARLADRQERIPATRLVQLLARFGVVQATEEPLQGNSIVEKIRSPTYSWVMIRERAEGRFPENGVKAAPDAELLLRDYGFNHERDIQGDEYYVGPAGHIIKIYSDGTWDSDKASAGWPLEKYLDWIRQLNAIK